MHEAIPNLSTLASGMVAGGVGVTAFWLGIVGTIWKMFLEPSIKRSEARCDDEIRDLKARIAQLETMYLLHAPQHLRAQMQGALSEIRVAE